MMLQNLLNRLIVWYNYSIALREIVRCTITKDKSEGLCYSDLDKSDPEGLQRH